MTNGTYRVQSAWCIVQGKIINYIPRTMYYALCTLYLFVGLATARPLITEEVQPLGKKHFQAGTSISLRLDRFGTPEHKYETSVFPVDMRIGITNAIDIGLTLARIGHKIHAPHQEFSGSASGLVNPHIKISPLNWFGVMGIWHVSRKEKNQSLPIGRGDDYELNALFGLPHHHLNPQFNIGYLFRDSYSSDFGIRGGPKKNVELGDVIQTRGSIEIPIRFGLNFLTELAYYSTDDRRVGGVTLANSSGDALDIMTGLTWIRGGWNIGGGVAFGLLNESHTSFDVERGAGDILYKFSLAYKLRPTRPQKWD